MWSVVLVFADLLQKNPDGEGNLVPRYNKYVIGIKVWGAQSGVIANLGAEIGRFCQENACVKGLQSRLCIGA